MKTMDGYSHGKLSKRQGKLIGDVFQKSPLCWQAARIVVFRDNVTEMILKILNGRFLKPTVASLEKRALIIGRSGLTARGQKIVVISCVNYRGHGLFIRRDPYGYFLDELKYEGVTDHATVVVAVVSAARFNRLHISSCWEKIDPDYILSPSLGLVARNEIGERLQPDWGKMEEQTGREAEKGIHSNNLGVTGAHNYHRKEKTA